MKQDNEISGRAPLALIANRAGTSETHDVQERQTIVNSTPVFVTNSKATLESVVAESRREQGLEPTISDSSRLAVIAQIVRRAA